MREAAGGEGVPEKQPGIQNQKQEPHTKLWGKTQGFVLWLPPQHKAHATSCSHSNAICHHSFKKRIELRTQEQPLVAKHIGGTIRDRNDRSRNRRTDKVPSIAGCSHFTQKNTTGFLPNTKPMQHHAAIPMRSATTASRNA